jgi:DNA-binding NarL/FixJ family response regulator
MISVLVADDQALVRAGIRMLIETQPDLRVISRGSGRDGRRERGRAVKP